MTHGPLIPYMLGFCIGTVFGIALTFAAIAVELWWVRRCNRRRGLFVADTWWERWKHHSWWGS